MPGRRTVEDPYDLLRDLLSRVRTLEQANRPTSFLGAQVFKNSDQIISSGLGFVTGVTFANPIEYDTDGFFDDANDQFVIPDDCDGYYLLMAKIEWETGTGPVRMRPRVNGSQVSEVNNGSSSLTTTQTTPPLIHYMNAGDTYDIVVAHNQGTNRKVLGDGTNSDTYFGLAFLGR